MATCSCGGTLGATGIDGCIIEFKTTHNFILMPLRKADGSLNFIDLSTPATLGSTLKTLTGNTTPALERLYPLPFSENVTREKGERLTESAPSGNIYNIQDGLRQNHAEFWGANGNFRFLEQLEKFGCSEMGFFSVDIMGTLEGWKTSPADTKLYPIPVMKNTYDAMYQYATDTSIQKVMLDFNTRRNFDETKIYYITEADLGYPATDLVGLIPCNIAVSNITSTGITATITKAGMSALSQKPLTGLLLANFTLQDLTGGAPVTITTVTESASGVYDLTYTSVAGTNDFELTTLAPGYDVPKVKYVDPL